VPQLKISQKLHLVLGLVSVVVLTVGFLGIRGMGSLNSRAKDLKLEVDTATLDSTNRALLSRLAEDSLQVAVAQTPQDLRAAQADRRDAAQQIEANFQRMRQLHADDQTETHLVGVEVAGFQKLSALAASGALRSGAGAAAAGKQIRAALLPTRAAAIKLAAIDEAAAAEAESAANSSYGSRRTLELIFILLGLAVVGGAVFALIRNLLPRITAYSAFAAKVAEGDLSGQLEPKGGDALTRLAENLNAMVQSLAQTTGRMQENAHTVSASASQILATVSQQTAGANQQSAAINQTTTATDEIRASAEQAAEKATDVADQAQQAVRVSDEGAEAVEAIVGGMGQIREKVEAIAADVQTLSEQTAQIGEITSAVNDLADQSNLLALNATIEAARAGEQGKGFAVVADEVRNLAEQSKQATAQVQSILADIEQATHAAVCTAQEGTEVVEHGTELAARAGEIIAQLADMNHAVEQSAQQIAASLQQQNAGMDQIAQGMHETSQATSEFVAGVHQSQAAAEGLTKVAGELEEVSSQYRL